MEIIRRKSDYALRSLSYMADFPQGQRFSLKLIAKKQRIPQAFLRKIFQALSSKKIISSQPGPSGGVSLLKRPQEISLKEVLQALQGGLSISDCLFKDSLCGRAKECRVRQGLSKIQEKTS